MSYRELADFELERSHRQDPARRYHQARTHALIAEQAAAYGVEDQTLIVTRGTGDGHRNIGFMDGVQIRSGWRNDFRAGDAAVETRLHYRACSDPPEGRVSRSLCLLPRSC